MKRFSLLAFYALLIAGVSMTFLPIAWFPKFYDVRYSGWSMIAGALIIYFSPYILRVHVNDPNSERKNSGITLLQFIMALAIITDALGALGLYELYNYSFPYSYILHLVMPLIGVILISLGISKRFEVSLVRSALIALAIVLCWGVVWEIYENINDKFFGTHLTGPDQTTAFNTTNINLVQDTIGACCGLIFILLTTPFSRKK